MLNNRKKVYKNRRLIYYQSNASAEFWDSYWNQILSNDYFKKYEKGDLDGFEKVFKKFLKLDDKILEAGCGTGKYLVALRSLGYKNVEGVEWGEKTVKRVKKIYPDLPIKIGDVTKLEAHPEFYDAYISIGVMEHEQDGPGAFLMEANRILKKDGIAFISVPYLNPLRKLKALLGLYKLKDNHDKEFYQYAFTEKEFLGYLREYNFDILSTFTYGGYFCIQEEFQNIIKKMKKLPGGWKLNNILKNLKSLDNYGHMIMFVCSKKF